MKTKYLFPHRYKLLGWLLFIPSLLALIYVMSVGSPDFMEFKVFSLIPDTFLATNKPKYWVSNNLADELLTVAAIIGGLLVVFTREKQEDELIGEIRKSSLMWAIYVNYGLYILATLLIYGFDFLGVLQVNVFTILVVFIVRFEWYKYQLKKSIDAE